MRDRPLSRSDLRSATLQFLVCVAFFAAIPAFSLDSAKRVTQYMHVSLQREDGLPQSSVQSIVQTRDGYLWFATQQGLARYNGERLTAFGNWNTPEIAGSDIQTLFEDRGGTLWIGSHGGGVTQYRDGRFSRAPFALSNRVVWSIAEDAGGALWIGTEGGLHRIRNGRVTLYTKKHGLPDDVVYAVLPARDGSVWIGTRKGLARIRGEAITTYTTRDGLPNDSVKTLYQDRAAVIWIGTRGGGAARLQNGTITPIGTREGLPNLDIFAIAEDRDNNIWIGTGGGGLVRLTGGRISVVTKREGALANDTVLALLEDREGNLWVGTDGGGVTRLKDPRFVSFSTADGLSSDVVMSTYVDHAGTVWIGSLGGGVNRIASGSVRRYSTSEGLSDDMVFAVAGDRRGAVWVGTQSGLNRIEGDRVTVFSKRSGLPSAAVSAIFEDRAGDLWFGTPDGLSRLRNGRFTNYDTSNGLSANFVLAVTEDRHGTLWVGTAGGLCRFDGQAFTSVLSSRNGLPDDLVMGLHEDQDGVLWIATRKGLARLADGRLTTFTRKEGLVDDLILATVDDRLGWLWISSNNGVSRIAKRELADLAAGRTKHLHPMSFGTADGLPSSECNGGVQPSLWRADDGAIWFPTIKGVAMIDPARIRVNRVPPRIAVEQIVVDDRIVPMNEKIRLAAGTHRLEINYAGLSFAAPERVRFRYALDGFDVNWVDAGSRRTAIYTGLRHGTYRFRVLAANEDGIWSTAAAGLTIEQAPFFYQTYTFAAICGVALIGLIGILLKLWAGRMRSEFAAALSERRRIAREFHDTVAQELVGVGLQLNLAVTSLDEDSKSTRRHIARATALTQESLQHIRRVLADLRTPAIEGEHIAAALEKFSAQLAEDWPIKPRVIVQGKPRRFEPAVENELVRIGQEAITNAVRHANAQKIDVELTFRGRKLTLRVLDDGVGSGKHDLEALARERYGVAGMRERAARIGAIFKMKSHLGEGTEVIVQFNNSWGRRATMVDHGTHPRRR